MDGPRAREIAGEETGVGGVASRGGYWKLRGGARDGCIVEDGTLLGPGLWDEHPRTEPKREAGTWDPLVSCH